MNLTPHTFWQLSLPEWRAVTAGFVSASVPMKRNDLDHLMKCYPDD